MNFEKQTLEKQTPERQALETQTLESQTPGRRTFEWQTFELQTLKDKLLKEKIPEKSSILYASLPPHYWKWAVRFQVKTPKLFLWLFLFQANPFFKKSQKSRGCTGL